MKKALSMLLATLMLLGVFAIGASAASLEDIKIPPLAKPVVADDLSQSERGILSRALNDLYLKNGEILFGWDWDYADLEEDAEEGTDPVRGYIFYSAALGYAIDLLDNMAYDEATAEEEAETSIFLEGKTISDLWAMEVEFMLIVEDSLFASYKAGTLLASVKEGIAKNDPIILAALKEIFTQAAIDAALKKAELVVKLTQLKLNLAVDYNEASWQGRIDAAEKELRASLGIDPYATEQEVLDSPKFEEYVAGMEKIYNDARVSLGLQAPASIWGKIGRWCVKYLLGGWLFQLWTKYSYKIK